MLSLNMNDFLHFVFFVEKLAILFVFVEKYFTLVEGFMEREWSNDLHAANRRGARIHRRRKMAESAGDE